MLTQLPRVPSLIPSSFATRAIGRDVSITIFTASSLNSGEKLFFGRGNYFTFPDVHPNGWTVRKLRGTSRGCGRTHVLLPADLWSRRRYGAAVILMVLMLAAAAAAAGRAAARPWLAAPGGGRRLVPASTAWSWRSRFAGRAGALRRALMGVLPLAAGAAAPVLVPAGSAAGDCLAALEAVTAGLRRFPGLAAVAAHEVAAHLTGGGWLAPAVPALR